MNDFQTRSNCSSTIGPPGHHARGSAGGFINVGSCLERPQSLAIRQPGPVICGTWSATPWRGAAGRVAHMLRISLGGISRRFSYFCKVYVDHIWKEYYLLLPMSDKVLSENHHAKCASSLFHRGRTWRGQASAIGATLGEIGARPW